MFYLNNSFNAQFRVGWLWWCESPLDLNFLPPAYVHTLCWDVNQPLFGLPALSVTQLASIHKIAPKGEHIKYVLAKISKFLSMETSHICLVSFKCYLEIHAHVSEEWGHMTVVVLDQVLKVFIPYLKDDDLFTRV